MLCEVGLSMQVAVCKHMTEKSKGAFRAKHFKMNFQRQPGGKTPPNARGVGGTLTETVYFFFKGTWPSKLEHSPRELFGGTVWDDLWSDVPQCGSMEAFSVPATVKRMVFEDVWSAQPAPTAGSQPGEPGEDATDDEGGEAGQSASAPGPSCSAPGQKDTKKSKKDAKLKKKDKKPTKEKKNTKDAKGKSGKADAKDAKKAGQKDKKRKNSKKKGAKENSTKRNMLSESRAIIAAPALFGDEERSPEDEEVLFSNDYHGSVWSACWREWGAKQGIVFTPGNGMAGVQAVQEEFPLLLLGMNEEHVQLLEYFVDCSVAMALQAAGPGNRLFDKDLSNRVRKALLGEDASDDDIVLPKSKKHQGEKSSKKKDSDAESDSDFAGTDSDGESDSDDE